MVGATTATRPMEAPIRLRFRRAARSAPAGLPAALADPISIAVFDGVGGVEGGHEASSLSALVLGDLLDDPTCDLTEMIEELDRRIGDVAATWRAQRSMATTVAGIRVSPGSLEVFNAGDSRVFVARDGYLIQESVDHSKEGRLTEFIGGGRRGVVPHVSSAVPVDVGSLVLICTDGLYRHVQSDVMERACAGASPISQLWELTHHTDDDAAVVVVRWLPIPPPTPPQLLVEPPRSIPGPDGGEPSDDRPDGDHDSDGSDSGSGSSGSGIGSDGTGTHDGMTTKERSWGVGRWRRS